MTSMITSDASKAALGVNETEAFPLASVFDYDQRAQVQQRVESLRIRQLAIHPTSRIHTHQRHQT